MGINISFGKKVVVYEIICISNEGGWTVNWPVRIKRHLRQGM